MLALRHALTHNGIACVRRAWRDNEIIPKDSACFFHALQRQWKFGKREQTFIRREFLFLRIYRDLRLMACIDACESLLNSLIYACLLDKRQRLSSPFTALNKGLRRKSSSRSSCPCFVTQKDFISRAQRKSYKNFLMSRKLLMKSLKFLWLLTCVIPHRLCYQQANSVMLSSTERKRAWIPSEFSRVLQQPSFFSQIIHNIRIADVKKDSFFVMLNHWVRNNLFPPTI